MPILQDAKAFNAQWSPNYAPIGVFIGGTSGIGEDMVQKFAKFTKGNCSVVIIGRNKAAAERIFSSLPSPPETSEPLLREFVYCDASLMSNTRACVQDLLAKLPKINFLVLTLGIASLFKKATSEGIDEQLALRYFSRWRFIHDLLPLVQKAADAGEDAKVLSILAAGFGFPVNVNDIPMRKAWGWRVPVVSPTYNDYALDEFSIRNPSIAFTHVHPGFVYTPAMQASKWYVRWLNPLQQALITDASDCGEYMWYGLLKRDKGFFRRNHKGDNVGLKWYEGNVTVRKAIWECSEELTGPKA